MDGRSFEAEPLQALLGRHRNDRDARAVRPPAEYLGLFPADEIGIAREFVSLEGGPAEPEPEAGGRIGNYRTLSELAWGGQARVSLAEDSTFGRKVALKVLEGLWPVEEEVIARFRREALAASALLHLGICTVYEARVEARTPYIAMQYVKGGTLARRIATTRGASPRRLPKTRARNSGKSRPRRPAMRRQKSCPSTAGRSSGKRA